MKQAIFIVLFVVVGQYVVGQPECFRTTDSSLLTPSTLSVLKEIHPFYEQLPGGYEHVIVPSEISLKSSIDTSYEQLELLAWDKNIRVRSFYLPYYADRIASDTALIESYLACAIRDTSEIAHRDRCLIYGYSFAYYTYSIFRPYLTESQWIRLSASWLKTTTIHDLKESLLQAWSNQGNYEPFFRDLIRNHDQYQAFNYLLDSPEQEDKELLLEYAKINPLEAHWLMRQYPDTLYIPYIKSQLINTPDYAYTDNLMSMAAVIDDTLYREVTATICQKLDPTKMYPFGQNIYNSDYYRGLNEQDKHQLLVKLLPSLNTIDSIDIDYLTTYQRATFDRAVSQRLSAFLTSEYDAYDNLTLNRVFAKYTENWTAEKQAVCRDLCEKNDHSSSVLATIALIEHNDPQTSELLLRHFQMDTTHHPDEYYRRIYLSIEAMTYSNDSILFQKVDAVLLQQFLSNDLRSDPFNYLYILDRSLIPGFYELLLKDMEKGPLTEKHTTVASFLLAKNNPSINKRLVVNYQKIHNQADSNYYNTEIGFYLTEYGLLNR